VYLEPFLSTAVAALEVAGALVHPYHDWALLVCPLGPEGFDLASCGYFGGKIGGCAAVAHDFSVGDGHRGVVVWPLP
jgi:hypothetical protein